MKINYITPANVEEMIEFVNFNTANDIAEFEAQIEAVHTAAIGGREIDVCIVSSKDPDVKIPFPQCILGWDGHPFVMVNVGTGLEDIRHLLLAVIGNIDMVDAGDLVYHGDGKESTFRGEFFSQEDALNHITPFMQQMISGEISDEEFSFRAIWTTPWALEAYRNAAKHYTAKYAL
jgi:hypothetical protein